MPVYQPADIADLVNGTLPSLGAGRWTQGATSLQRYTAVKWLKEKSVEEAGDRLEWSFQYRTTGNAERVGMFHVDSHNFMDTMIRMNCEFVGYTKPAIIDEQMVDMNKGEAKIYDVLNTQDVAAELGMIETLETDAWSLRTSSQTDRFNGIPYYIVKNNTLGFNGGNPSGHSDCAGQSSSIYTTWANYSGQYTNITADDLVAKLAQAILETEWESPVSHPQYGGMGTKRMLYTETDVYLGLAELARQQNDRNGPNLLEYQGKTVLGGNMVEWVPKLNADTTNPVYGVNWDTFDFVIIPGWNMRRTKAEKLTGTSHTTLAWYRDLRANLRCTDRRQNFVLATNT